MPNCKNCLSDKVIKSGKANGKQRYCCNDCGYHFVEGDTRTDEKIAAKKALCVIFYLLGKCSFRMLAKLFKTSPSLVHRWIVDAGCKPPDPKSTNDVKEIEFDEMQNFFKDKKNFESSGPFSVVSGELWSGYSVIVMLQRSEGSNR